MRKLGLNGMLMLTGIMIIGLQYRLWVPEGSLASIVWLKREILAQETINAQLAQRNKRLASKVAELKNGLDSVEEHARNELGMVRGDETFYLVVKR